MTKEWQRKKLGDLVQFSRVRNTKENLPYIGLEDIESNTGSFLGSKESRSVKSSTFYFTENHILYGRLRPYLNKVYLPDFEGHCSTEIFPLELIGNIDKKFLYYWLTKESTVTKINKTCTGARMPRADMSKVLAFELDVPDVTEQKRIAFILDEVFADLERVSTTLAVNIANTESLYGAVLSSYFNNSKNIRWQTSYLKDIASFTYGYTTKAKNAGEQRYVRITDIDSAGNLSPDNKVFVNDTNIDANYVMHKGELFMVRVGASYGKVLYFNSTEPAVFASYLIKISLDDSITSKLYWYFTKSNIYWSSVNALVTGSAQPQFNANTLKNLTFSYPINVSKQNELIDLFDKLSLELANIRSIYKAKTLKIEELKKSILNKAFSGEL